METIILILFLGNSHMMQVIFDDAPACNAALEKVKAENPRSVTGICVSTSSEPKPRAVR